jgi:hypothetical protein
LFGFIQATIEKELVEELNFLKNYDIIKRAVQEIIDMPNQRIDLFSRFCLQNNGVISPRKHKSHFSELTDNEIEKCRPLLLQMVNFKPSYLRNRCTLGCI